jgi:Zn-dependent protease
MVRAAKFVRWAFGFQAIVYASLLVTLPWILKRAIADGDYSGAAEMARAWRGISALVPIELGLCILFTAAWWNLRKGTRSARAWALTASIASLPFLGLGTVAGIIGLFVFTRHSAGHHIRALHKKKLPKIAGDGTHGAIEALAKGAGIFGAIAGNFLWTGWGLKHGLPAYSFVSFLVQLELAALFSVVIHELGHVLGGWASHMKLRRFEAGPFEFQIRSGKREFRFNHAKILDSGGSTAMVMTSLKNIRSRRVFVSACGPMASLLLGCFALAATLSAAGRPWQSMWQFWSLTATFSLLSFAINLIPLRPEDQYSDGAHIYQIVTNGPWADVHTIFSIVASSLVTPLRPRDYDMPMLFRAAQFMTFGREAMLLRIFGFTSCVDRGHLPEAIGWLSQAEAIYPQIAGKVPAELHAEFVFGAALFKRDAAAARMWWERMQSKRVTRFDTDYWKARAALAWIENRSEDAQESWRKGNQLAQALPKAGAYDFDRDNFVLLREAMESQSPPPLPGPPPIPTPVLAMA